MVNRVVAMREHLDHRGPDGGGLWKDTTASLAATRLAIRGLAGGFQPVSDEESQVFVVCNGELDNYRGLRQWLSSRGRTVPGDSDVDILPALYLELGEKFVEVIEGPFAIALWDTREKKLLLARDRVGERPLFYFKDGEQVVFATELAALALGSPEPLVVDSGALQGYQRFGRFSAPDSPLKGIHKLAPSEIISFVENQEHRRRYWSWRLGVKTRAHPTGEWFDHVFRRAVRRQTVCDVDFGVFLSGGVDSSLVAAVCRDLHPHRTIPAYTLRFNERSYDEGEAARAVADRLRFDMHEVWVHPEEIPAKLRDLMRLVGEPLGDPAWIPTALLAERAVQDVKMVLIGEGADELFGGYPTYLGASLAHAFLRLPRSVRSFIRAGLQKLPPSERKVPLSFLLKRFVESSEERPLARHQVWTSVLPTSALDRLGTPTADLPHPPEPTDRELDAVQRFDLTHYLGEGLLTKSDRASLAFALEPRAPFLDRGVLEFAAGLKASERVRGLSTKVFLKHYATKYLPRRVVHQRKRGLSVPLSAWLRGPLNAWASERLANPRLAGCGLRLEVVHQMLTEHVERRADWGRALWLLIVLSEWLDWLDETRQSLEVPVP